MCPPKIRFQENDSRGMRRRALQATPLLAGGEVGQGDYPRRRSIRLRDFDYAQNRAYFVTICAAQRLCLFGDVVEGRTQLSAIGLVVAASWQDLPHHTPALMLDAWVIMPNHLHGIVVLPGTVATPTTRSSPPHGPKPQSLGAVVRGFKSAVSREVGIRNPTLVRPIWQRNYYERIIRNDRELDAIRRYIMDNPVRWDADPDHPRHHPAPNPPHHP
jgi:putative transposase